MPSFSFLAEFKDSTMGEDSTCDERLGLLDEQVRDYLAKAFKAEHSTKQTDCMIGYMRDMLLKVRRRILF